MKKFSQSIYDTLIYLMPNLKERLQSHGDAIDPVAARSLFSIWRTGEEKSNSRIFKRPVTIGQDEVQRMKDAGLIRQLGDNIEITDKGSKVIKIMVLGDNRSIFEDDDSVIDYSKALTETKGVQKMAKQCKVAQNISWWDRFKKD